LVFITGKEGEGTELLNDPKTPGPEYDGGRNAKPNAGPQCSNNKGGRRGRGKGKRG